MIAHRLYVGTIGEGLFRSLDGGASFRRACEGMFVECHVRALAVHPQQPATLYLGSELGLFVSTDGAESWTKLPAPWTVCKCGRCGSRRIIRNFFSPVLALRICFVRRTADTLGKKHRRGWSANVRACCGRASLVLPAIRTNRIYCGPASRLTAFITAATAAVLGSRSAADSVRATFTPWLSSPLRTANRAACWRRRTTISTSARTTARLGGPCKSVE